MTDSTTIDVSQFKAAASALRKAQPVLYKGLGEMLDRAGTVVAATAESIVAEHSESIPTTIRVRRRGLGVRVVAGGPEVPIAGLYEKGNKDARESASDPFRHPVFGNDAVWVNQKRFAFLAPAGEREKHTVNAMVEAVLQIVSEIIVLED